MMIQILRLPRCAVAALILAAFAPALTHAQERPNIVLLMSDDHSWYDVSVMGNPDVRTPNLDRLRDAGMNLWNVHTTTSICMPSRFQIQSGRFPNEMRLYGNNAKIVSQREFETLASVMGRNGYRTVLAGKRHLPPESNYPYEFLTEAYGVDEKSVEAFKTFIAQPQEKPFLFVFTFHDPHTNWPTKLIEESEKPQWAPFESELYDPAELTIPPTMADTPITRRNLAAYYQEVTRLDRHLGEVLAALDASVHRDNTLVIWTSEQGMQTPRGKWTCYDLGLRTATFALWPGRIEPGSTSDALVQYVDFLPTFNELAGGEPVSDIDGRSFLPVLFGVTDTFRDEVYGATFGFYSVRTQAHKYIWNSNRGKPFKHMFMSDFENESTELYRDLLKAEEEGNAKAQEILDWLRAPPHEELYEVAEDPFELDNRIDRAELADVREDLRQRLRAWLVDQKDEKLPRFDQDFRN